MFIARSHPEDRDDGPDPVPTTQLRDPESVARVEPPDPPELLDCGQCEEVHGPEPCATALHDRAAELLADLRARGAKVAAHEGKVRLSGYSPTADEAEAIRNVKPPLLMILRAEGQQR